MNNVVRTCLFVSVALLIGMGLVGCSQSGTPKVETVEAPVADPLVEVKAILTNYSNGMPVTSEAESFPQLVESVKAKHPAKGEILEKGLNQIKQNPATAQAKAKELLKQL
jgi:hypothetical protein